MTDIKRQGRSGDGSSGDGSMTRRGGRDPFRRLQNEMNRLFENFGSGMSWSGGSSMQRSGFEGGFSPRVDVSEDAESLKINAELPGMNADDVEITATEDSVTIKGEKKSESTEKGDDFFHSERSYGYFKRSIPLPVDADTDNAEATFKDGVLNIRMPKTGESKAKRLEIK